jgi:hypothetical protein
MTPIIGPIAINHDRYFRLMRKSINARAIRRILSPYSKYDIDSGPFRAGHATTTDEFVYNLKLKLTGEEKYAFTEDEKHHFSSTYKALHDPLPTRFVYYLCNCPMCANGYYGKSGNELTHAAIVHEFIKSGGKRLVTRFEQLTKITQDQTTNQG